jgi:hypothetical protein
MRLPVQPNAPGWESPSERSAHPPRAALIPGSSPHVARPAADRPAEGELQNLRQIPSSAHCSVYTCSSGGRIPVAQRDSVNAGRIGVVNAGAGVDPAARGAMAAVGGGRLRGHAHDAQTSGGVLGHVADVAGQRRAARWRRSSTRRCPSNAGHRHSGGSWGHDDQHPPRSLWQHAAPLRVQALGVVNRGEVGATGVDGQECRARWFTRWVATGCPGAAHGCAGCNRNVPGQRRVGSQCHGHRLSGDQANGRCIVCNGEGCRRIRR